MRRRRRPRPRRKQSPLQQNSLTWNTVVSTSFECSHRHCLVLLQSSSSPYHEYCRLSSVSFVSGVLWHHLHRHIVVIRCGWLLSAMLFSFHHCQCCDRHCCCRDCRWHPWLCHPSSLPFSLAYGYCHHGMPFSFIVVGVFYFCNGHPCQLHSWFRRFVIEDVVVVTSLLSFHSRSRCPCLWSLSFSSLLSLRLSLGWLSDIQWYLVGFYCNFYSNYEVVDDNDMNNDEKHKDSSDSNQPNRKWQWLWQQWRGQPRKHTSIITPIIVMITMVTRTMPCSNNQPSNSDRAC